MVTQEDINELIELYTDSKVTDLEADILIDLDVFGDDFHDLIENYGERFNVDLSDYLWYFHGNEEGMSGFVKNFFPPPYERVNRIPVTPKLLKEFADNGKWEMDYPEHSLPKRRWDLTLNAALILVILILGAIYYLTK